MENATKSAMVWIPKSRLTRTLGNQLGRELRYKQYDMINEENTYFEDWMEEENGTWVPRDFGLEFCHAHDIEVDDVTSVGQYSIICTERPVLRDYQVPFVQEILEALQSHNDVRVEAHTGSGKTIMSCYVATELGLPTLIFVDQEFLRDQWVETLTKFYGIDESEIGIVQGPKCEYQDKSFVIAMVQTAYSRTFDPEFYNWAGLIIYDESHTIGAEKFSETLRWFNARYRLAPSATPDRRDMFQKVLEHHLGPVRCRLQKQHKPSQVRYLESPFVPTWYASVSPKIGRYVSEIAEWAPRNHLIAQAIEWLYNSGREVLAISDRLEQLSEMRDLLYFMGIPPEEIGIIAGYEYRMQYAKEDRPKRKPIGWEQGTDYTPVSLQNVKKRIPKKELDRRKEECAIRLASYGMFSKGVDVPSLAGGVDMTPRSEFEQVHGRILRDKEGKKEPIFVTIRDKDCFRAEFQFLKRLNGYAKSNAEVYKWVIGKGVQKQDTQELKRKVRKRVETLKGYRIETTKDGRNIVMTPSTGKPH